MATRALRLWKKVMTPGKRVIVSDDPTRTARVARVGERVMCPVAVAVVQLARLVVRTIR